MHNFHFNSHYFCHYSVCFILFKSCKKQLVVFVRKDIRKYMTIKIIQFSFRSAVSLLIILSLLTGCQSKKSQSDGQEPTFDTKNYYPERVKINHAKGFTIQYFNHYKVVNILSPFEKTTDTTKYLLLQRGSTRPENYADYQVIEVPIRSLVAMSSMHVGLLGFWNLTIFLLVWQACNTFMLRK